VFSLPFVTQQQGKNAYPIALLRKRLTDQLGERGHVVPKGKWVIALPTGRHPPLPRYQGGNTDRPLVQIPLVPRYIPLLLKKSGVATPFTVRPVIAGENDQSVLENTCLLELVDNLTHVEVDAA